MSDESKIMLLFLFCVCIICTILVYNNHANDKMIYELIKEGHDPIEIRCAYEKSSACDEYITNRNK